MRVLDSCKGFCLLLLIILAVTARCALAATQTFDVTGKLLWPEGEASAAEFKLIVSTDGIIQMYAWPQADGKFVIHGLPAGSHLLDVLSVNLVYPQLRIDVSAQGGGRVLATFAQNDLQRLPEPLIIRPLGRAEYFEQRAPFNVIAFLKSPYGLMIIFGLLAVFVLPQMKVDPEDYQEMMKQMQPSGSSTAVANSSQRRRQ